ncbi:suppressor of fused domain protein [Paenibacillus aurantius]|uniref:Suppressor of fused domain protein n=1 Tax=Paenibacillus aurantius TaxID=2918900 RepID=A0AA96LC83_9BACL|nr:suppressor of fused domain protein [Paenibacillus aurantius]WNQ10986.1 suppressor of fused domain protein [Paenibacillus aurantius]
MNHQEEQAPGWEAIDRELERLYEGQEPKVYGTLVPYALGGPDPLTGISAYRAEEPRPHWHFVTYGFSELYEKESDDPACSGYGFELTSRLVRDPIEEEPPAWALNLLQNMGRYVFRSGNVFRAGDYLDANGPICLGADTELTALAFVEDPELPGIDTPNGRVDFLQMVGMTGDELEAMQAWNTRGVLKAGSEHLPSCLTDLSRPSLLEEAAVAAAIREGMAQAGSSTGFLYVDQLGWEPGRRGLFGRKPDTLSLGAKQAGIIAKILRGRIPKDRELRLVGPETRVVLEPGAAPGWEAGEEEIRIALDSRTAEELAERLVPREGTVVLPSLPKLEIRIVRTDIRDADGNVMRTIG